MSKRLISALLTLALLFVPNVTHARYLNPSLGRFMTMDSFEGNPSDPQSLHKYVYANNNPVNGIDPSGHFVEGNVGGLLGTTTLQFGMRTAQASSVVVPRLMARGIMKWAWIAGGIGAGVQTLVQDTELGMEIQVAVQANPTGSKCAYQLEQCDGFARDADLAFRKNGKVPKRIIYDANRPNTREGFIYARDGFGFFGGRAIAQNGHHEGVLVDGRVYDNNVPFGVPRMSWEEGYEVSIINVGEMSIGRSHARGFGRIMVK